MSITWSMKNLLGLEPLLEVFCLMIPIADELRARSYPGER